jgi:hypothetical protein
MEIFENIRLKTGKAILRKKMSLTKRSLFYANIESANNVGIVWDASKPDEFSCLSRFHQNMHDRNIDVKIIGYFPQKKLPDQYTAIRYLTCLKKQDINIFYRPVSSEANTFVHTRFDILIDINFKKLFPLYYISSLSLAGFKVGLFDSETDCSPFDLMMELKDTTDIDNYLSDVLYYLQMIKTGS